jgi:glycosyltransferase involved in cell wall biosynthesis
LSDSAQSSAKGMMPTVSVIIPVRNGERTIARAIDSALAQTYAGPVEVIVINNGSTDCTSDIIRNYGARIVPIDEPAPGAAQARNAGIAIARGKYLAFLDADDEWMPDKLARIVPMLEADPECVLAYHDAIEMDTHGRVIKTSYYPVEHNSAPTLRDLLAVSWPGLPILPTNVVMRRDVAVRVGGFHEALKAMEDVAMWICAREQGPFRFMPEVLARREWEPSERREEGYIHGAYGLREMLRPRYGGRVAAAAVIPILNWAGTMAMLRGERALARRHYLASLRLRPTRLKTWIRLCTTLLPTRLLVRGEGLRHERIYGPSDRTIAAAAGAHKG